MKINDIFKRQKTEITMPNPLFENNWMQERFEQNVKEGVDALQKGLPICIYEDGRGYELAIEIKHRFILEYQKQLSEKIKITGSNIISISFDKN